MLNVEFGRRVDDGSSKGCIKNVLASMQGGDVESGWVGMVIWDRLMVASMMLEIS